MWTGAIPVNVTTGSETGWKVTPVCVQSPFFFLVTNTSIVRDSLNCFNEKYLLIACWMWYSTMAILMREPAAIWMTVVNTIHFHAVTLMTGTHNPYTGGRGIAGIARATAATVVMTQTTTMAETVIAVVSKSVEGTQA